MTPTEAARFAKAYAKLRVVDVNVYAGSDGKLLATYEPDGVVNYFT